MTNNQLTRIWIALLVALTLIGALCVVFVPVHAAGAKDQRLDQLPFVHDVTNGVITVWHPSVCGADVGLLSVTNASTGEAGPIYLAWKACVAGLGIYQSDPIQLVIMGSGIYFITDGTIGPVDIYIPDSLNPFTFQAWRLWTSIVLK